MGSETSTPQANPLDFIPIEDMQGKLNLVMANVSDIADKMGFDERTSRRIRILCPGEYDSALAAFDAVDREFGSFRQEIHTLEEWDEFVSRLILPFLVKLAGLIKHVRGGLLGMDDKMVKDLARMVELEAEDKKDHEFSH